MRRRWRALLAVASLLVPGAGQVVLGRYLRAALWFGCRWPLVAVFFVAPRLFAFAFPLAVGVVALASAVDAAVAAPRQRHRWPLCAGLIVALVVLQYAGSVEVRDHLLEAYKLPSASMEPTLLAGDHIFADKRRFAPARGDVVVFRRAGHDFVKRVAGLQGDHVEGVVVPDAAVFLLGDNRDNSYDSRKFGPVPLSDLRARVRVIWYSSDAHGTRWSRIGRLVD
jgi:signal peptidase I